MKKIAIYIILLTVTSIGCTKSFDALNTNPTQASAANFDPNLLLPTGELGFTGSYAGNASPSLIISLWAQIFASAQYPSYYSNGDKYVASGNLTTYQASIWNGAYGAAVKMAEIESLTADKPELSNLTNIAIIVKLLNFQLITDVYGDIPFTQALQAKASVTLPIYDKQSDIYPALLSQLDAAITALDASKAKPTNDALPYKGDITKWKKFGYSLMLRMAMRLTKVDAATAQKYAEKAAAGGAMAGVDDDAYILYDNADGFGNPNSGALVVPQDYSEIKWGQYLINYLKTSVDPRLGLIAEGSQPGVKNSADQSLPGVSNPAVQIGMPNGYDENGGATDIKNAPGYPGASGTGDDANPVGNYSRIKTSVYLGLNAPVFIMTYAETELLFAEAAARGWSVGGSAAAHYAKGLSAALQSYKPFASSAAIDATTADAYALAHPLDVSSLDASLKQINEQFWATTGTLFNFVEAWSNWRRSGYPALTPVNYVGNFSGGTIPRREAYPVSEATQNGANYKSAVSALTGGDLFSSRVWWDK